MVFFANSDVLKFKEWQDKDFKSKKDGANSEGRLDKSERSFEKLPPIRLVLALHWMDTDTDNKQFQRLD